MCGCVYRCVDRDRERTTVDQRLSLLHIDTNLSYHTHTGRDNIISDCLIPPYSLAAIKTVGMLVVSIL